MCVERSPWYLSKIIGEEPFGTLVVNSYRFAVKPQ